MSADINEPLKPFTKAQALTKSDSTAYTGMRGLYVGGTGDVALILDEDSAAVTFKAVPAGTTLDVSFTKFMSTNTTATNVVGLK
jgi:hypothetical protein